MNKNCNNISSQRNKYSIRKLTVGTASLLIGATLVFGLGNEAYADELASQEKNNTVANSNENSEPHEQQESTTVDKSQEQSVQQSTQEQTAHETKHIDEAQQSTNETTSQSTASQHEHINKDVTNEHESNEEQQNKEESIETQTEPINNKEESVLTEHKPEETKQQITEAEASTEESETSSLQAPKNSNVNNSINKPQIIRPEEQKNENTKESRKVNGQAQPDKQTQNKKLKKVVATHEASTRSLKRTKRQTTANRDKTEDASLETLDYSDNYTFQTLIFDPEKLIDNNILKGKRIPFKIHSYMIGANSGERYKINLQLDEVIANHITKVSAIPANQSMPVEFTRLENAIGKKTNIWQVNYIRANNGLFGGAEILSQYTAEGGVIELDDTVENILNSQTDLFADKLNYLIYVKDAQENKKIKTSETSGYFLTKAEESYTNLKKSTSDAANNAFKASCGSVQFDASIGEYGAFVGDQQILKNGILNYGGPLLDSGLNKQWTYHYKIDPKLLPFAGQIELHRYDFKGLSGFDKTYYEDTRVAILPVNANGEGSITSYDLNSIIEFNNSLPETVGIRIVVKFNQTPNNILIRDAKFDDNGNLIADTSKIKEEFTFYGYLTDRFGGLIKNTFGTSTYYIQDIDRDGLTDNFEIHSSHTDPFNSDTDNDGNTDGNEFMNLRTSPLVAKPVVQDVSTDMDVIKGTVRVLDGATEQEVKIMDSQNKEIGKGKLETNGDFSIKVSNLKPGQYTANIISSKYKNPEKSTFNALDITEMLKPVIEEVNETDLDIGVTGIEGSTITVKDNKGKFIGRVNIAKGQSGAFIKLKQPLKVGTVLIATAKKGRNTSVPSDPVTVIDSASIDAPIVNPVSNRDSSVTGTTEPNAIIRVVLPNDMEILSKGDENGRFEVLLPDDYKLKVGDKIEVIAISGKGISSEPASVTVQGYIGFPIVQPVTTKSKVITGLAASGSLISVKLPDGSILYGKAADSGDFEILLPSHIKYTGGERLELSAISQPGNFALSTPIIVQDMTPPEVPIVNEINSESSQITGTAEAGSTVKVELPDGSEVIDVTNYQGEFIIDLPANQKFRGGEQLKVTSTDASGNKSTAAIVDVKDITPPVVPTVSEVTSESPQVSGTAEAGSTVKVELPDGTELTGVADDQGNYGIDIPANKKFRGGEQLKVTSTDASGNKSTAAIVEVKDTTPPVAPTVSEVTSESPQVSGTAEAGSTVKVELPDGTELTGIADDQGNYTIDLPSNKKFNGGESIKVTSTDASGNKSDEKVIDVKDTTPPVAPTVSEVTSESPQVSGTAEAGSTVKVELPDGTELTGVADDQGNYTIDLPDNKKFNGGESIKITSTDASGNKSDEAIVEVKDTTPPAAPTVSEVTSESTQVTGTGEPGSTVKVELPDGTELTGVADDQGNYGIDIPANKKFRGGEQLKVTSTDLSGNKSNEAVVEVKDTTPPVAPTVSEVTSESPQVSGTAEAGSTVKVELPDGTELTGVADDQGNYTIDLPSNKKFNGGESIKVTSTDPSGNKSDEKVIDVKDTTSPVTPTVSEVTSESTQVTGIGEPGSTVKVELPDGTELTGVADDQGNYVIDIPANQKFRGGEQLKVTSTDASGNKSDAKVIDVKDTTPPVAPTVSEVTSESPQISGTAEAGSTVKVELPNGTELTGVADDQGNYTIDFPANKKFNGGESIKVTSTDASGNKSDEKVIDVKDTTPPVAPTVSEVTSESTQITGTGEPGSTVKVELPDGTELTGVADDQGNYTIDLPDNKKFNGGESIKITSTDASGNKSDEAIVEVKDTTPPAAPTVSEVTSESTQVTGTGEPGSTVKVELPDGTELKGVADDQGNYTIDLPSNKKFNGGESVKVTSTDASGNKSDEKVIDVKDTTPPVAPTVSEVTSESTQVTGTGEPGSTVKVELPDGTVLDGVTDDQGNYTIDLPTNKKFNGGEQLKVTSTDASGNKSDEKVIDVKDTTPPAAPTVSEVTSESTQITGTGEPGTTVKVELPDGTELTGVADDQGNYGIDIPANQKFRGGEQLKVTSTDASGNKSDEKVIDVKDTTPPVAPTVSEVTSESTQVTGTGEPGSTVKVELPDGTELTGVADDQGNYTIDLPGNKKFNGGEQLKVTSTDPSGNKSDEKVIGVKDTTPPVAPTVSEVTSESPQVSGTAEAESTVKVELPDGTELTGVADDQGNYGIDIPANQKFRGGEQLKVTSTDASGNKSNEAVVEVKDTTPPFAPLVFIVSSEDTQISGESEPGSIIKVELPDGTELTGVADDQGNYGIDLPANKKFRGGEQLKVTSTDTSGNKSKEIPVKVRDVTPPNAPTVNEVTSKHSQITGTAEVESEVNIELPDGTKLKGVTDDRGNYSIDIPNGKEFRGGEQLKVTSTDISGNESQITNIIVKDTTPPFAPLVEIVTSEGNQIRGASESGSIVKVELPDGTKLTGVANTIEKFVIDIPSDKKLQGGDILKVTATDQEGNKSLVTTINVIDTTPPKAPSVLPLTSENVEISVVGEPGSTIKILLPDNTELIGQADNQGVSVIALPGNKKFQGGERLRVTSTDATGNESLETVVEIIDVTPPKAPSVNPVTSESLQITGTTEPNTSVKVIMPDSTELVTIANDRGEFTIDLTVSKKLQGGENLKIKSIDTAGNVSHEAIVEVKDTTPPLTPIVNPINSESTNIVGRAEPKTTVKVELPDGTNLMAKVDSNGNYTIDIPRINKFQGGENIKVSSIDDAGNKSQAITINVKDATPPTIPTIDEFTSESTQVSGTSEPGSTIKLVLPDGTELSNVTDDQGNYVIDLTNVLFNGGEELNVTSTDITGNRSEILKLTVKDVTAPEAPSVNPVTSENMSVTGISEPGSIVKVVLPNGSELTDVANNQGEYTIDLSQIKLTANDKLKVTATDAVGNKSEVTTIEYKDITPPITPKVNQITSESTQITGSGEPNTAVKLKLPNGLDLIAIINDQGNFTINLPSDYKLQGNEKVIVFGIDESLNISEEKIIDVRDITPPKAPQVYPIASSSFSLSGMSEPETQIIVKLPNGKLIYGEADKQGIYSVKVLDEYVFQGGETIEVTATDKAGNMSKPTTIVVDDDTPPSPPVIYEVTSDSKSISGKTEPFATIKVAVSYKDLIVGKANKKGEFNLPIPKGYNLDGGEEMRITSTDISGNVSDKTYIIVKDVTAPKPPSVLPITSESEEIIGKTEPNAIITVKISNGNKFTENADNFGNYVISIPKNFKLNGGEKIQLSATDPSGNVSDVSEIIVADITPPTVPTAKPLTSKDLQIIGTGEPQSTIRVELPNGTQLLGKVDNNGKYVIDLPNKVIFNGGENIKIVSTDKAGNMSLPLILMVKDTTPPVMPKIDSFTTESKQLTGITEPDAVVNAQLPTGEKLSVKADNKGAFVIDLPSGLVFKGGEKLSITAVDAQGNETSPIIIIVKDTTIPETPKVNKVTSESTHITGTAEPGAIVKVKLPNGKLLTAQVDKQGTFNVKLPSKGTFKGGEVLEVSVVDPSSNESLATTIHVEDITAPKSPTVKPITSDNPLVVGTAEVGSTIKVKLPNGKVISTKVDKQGNYKVKIPNNFKLNDGESLIITATDVSGNTSEEITVKVTDNTAPTNPNVNPIDKDSKNISGTAEANATIKIKLPNGKVLGGNADSKGRFDIKVPETVDLSKMKSIKVIAIDANGNTSNEVNVDIEQTNHTQEVIHNNGTVNDQQSNMSHSQALEHVQSGIEQGLNGQHDADKSMNSDHENEASGSNHEQGELPSTGQNDAVNTTAYGSLMALIGSSLLFTRRRKSNDKNKQDN